MVLCTAALTLFTSCSNDEVIAEEKVDVEAMIAAGMAPSDQKVELSAALDQTRASIESDANGNFSSNSNDVFGVMMLATGFIPKWAQLANDQSIDWGQYYFDEKTMKKGVWARQKEHTAYLANTEAYVSNSMLRFRNGDVYYPVGSFHKYSFYAYNPRVKDIEYHPNQVIAVMDSLDGSKDVIWGCIEPSSEITSPNYDPYADMAFCADYWRIPGRYAYYGNGTLQTPPQYMKFNFKHLMMRLKFNIIAGADDETLEESQRVYDNAYDVKVRSISVTNVSDTVKLIIADRDDKERQGTLELSKSRNRAYYLKQYRKVDSMMLPDSTLEAVSPQYDANKKPVLTPVGQGIILPVLKGNERKERPYQLQVVVEYKGSYYTLKKSIPLATYDDSYFEQGASYNITLKIYNPETAPGDWVMISNSKIWDYLDPDFISPEEQEEIDRRKEEKDKDKKQKIKIKEL